MALKVITYPNPLLRKKSEIVREFNQELWDLLDEMYEIMIAKNGVGISAIQVAKPIRALLVCVPRDDENWYKEDLIEMLNPQIIEREGSCVFNEGCLSVPEFFEEIGRAKIVKIAYQDRHGEPCELIAHDYAAVAFQHEIDHLDGILFIDKLPILKRKKFEKELKAKAKEQSKSPKGGNSSSKNTKKGDIESKLLDSIEGGSLEFSGDIESGAIESKSIESNENLNKKLEKAKKLESAKIIITKSPHQNRRA